MKQVTTPTAKSNSTPKPAPPPTPKPQNWRLVHTLKGHSNSVQCVAISPNGKTLASGSLDNADAIRERGVGQGQVNQLQSDYQNMKIGELANLAAEGDEEAETAIKILKQARKIGLADCIIAAIAIQNNLTLITGNLPHYQRIQILGYNLKLDNWRI